MLMGEWKLYQINKKDRKSQSHEQKNHNRISQHKLFLHCMMFLYSSPLIQNPQRTLGMVRKVQHPCKFISLCQHLNLMFWDLLQSEWHLVQISPSQRSLAALSQLYLTTLHVFSPLSIYFLGIYEGTCVVKSFHKAELCLETLRDCCGLTLLEDNVLSWMVQALGIIFKVRQGVWP